MKENKMKKKVSKFEIFYENHHPTRHIKYKTIDFDPLEQTYYGKQFSFNQFGTISKTD